MRRAVSPIRTAPPTRSSSSRRSRGHRSRRRQRNRRAEWAAVSTCPEPDHPGQDTPPSDHGGARPAVAAPRIVPGPTVPARVFANGSPFDYDTVIASVERVIQRIFMAGVLLHAASGNGDDVRSVQSVLDQLDAVLSDIHVTVLS